MSSFTFTGTQETYYPSLALLVQPGDTHEFDKAPDALWTADKATPAPASSDAPSATTTKE